MIQTTVETAALALANRWEPIATHLAVSTAHIAWGGSCGRGLDQCIIALGGGAATAVEIAAQRMAQRVAVRETMDEMMAQVVAD